jgi:phage-related protein
MRGQYRKIVFFESHFIDFYNEQSFNTQRKIEYVFSLLRVIDVIPLKFFKSITNASGLFEIRVKTGEKNIRIFCVFTDSKEILLLNAFIKKSQKLPAKELELARKLQIQAMSKK